MHTTSTDRFRIQRETHNPVPGQRASQLAPPSLWQRHHPWRYKTQQHDSSAGMVCIHQVEPTTWRSRTRVCLFDREK